MLSIQIVDISLSKVFTGSFYIMANNGQSRHIFEPISPLSNNRPSARHNDIGQNINAAVVIRREVLN